MPAEGRLRLATPLEKLQRDEATSAVWGTSLTVAQFVERERRLRAHDWAQKAMCSWWWVDEADEPLASCETFELASQVGVHHGVTWLIASVFTAPRLRNRGHAAQMLETLAARAKAQRVQALVLYSEIGVRLYERVGFRAAPAFDLILPAHETGIVLPECNQPGRTFVSATDMLVLDRSPHQLDWQLERERFYASALGRSMPRTHSAELEGVSIGWTAYFKTNELHVTWLDDGEIGVRLELLRAAQQVAATTGLSCVRVWVSDVPSWASDYPDARVVSRDDEVPMFRPIAVDSLGGWLHIERGMWA